MSTRETKTLVTEWLLKIAIIFYLADVLVNTGDTAVSVAGIDFSFVFILKLIVLFIFTVILFAVQRNLFKKIGFLALIFGAAFKALMYLSSDDFVVAQLINIAPEILIISFSTYYLYRTFKKPPRKKIKSTSTRRRGKTS